MKRSYLIAYTLNNVGDDLFIKIICERYPKIDFFIELDKEKNLALNKINNLHIINNKNFLFRLINKVGNVCFNEPIYSKKIISHCESSILVGGSMFMEDIQDNWKGNYKTYQRVKSWSDNFFVIGSNFGPYEHEAYKELYKSFFKKCNDVCFRDKYSAKEFADQQNVRYAPDVVFNLKTSLHIKKKKVSVVPILLEGRGERDNYRERYERRLADVISKLVEYEGYDVSLLSFCRDEGDENAIVSIMNKVVSKYLEKIKIVYYRDDYEPIIYEIFESEAVITSRFHGMILGWLGDTKVYPIVYNPKSLNAMNSLGFVGDYSSIDSTDPILLETVFDKKQELNIKNISEEAEKQFTALDLFFGV